MGRAQMANPEQQRVEDGKERGELANQINAALARIALNQARLDEARAKHERAINAARSEEGTAKVELAKSVVAYNALRERALALLPVVNADGTTAAQEDAAIAAE